MNLPSSGQETVLNTHLGIPQQTEHARFHSTHFGQLLEVTNPISVAQELRSILVLV